MRRTTWTSGRSRCRSCAGRRTWGRRWGGAAGARGGVRPRGGGGEGGTGNVVEATRHMRSIRAEIGRLAALPAGELFAAAKQLAAPYELVAEVAAAGALPVVLFTAGGIATPADAAMMMQL